MLSFLISREFKNRLETNFKVPGRTPNERAASCSKSMIVIKLTRGFVGD